MSQPRHLFPRRWSLWIGAAAVTLGLLAACAEPGPGTRLGPTPAAGLAAMPSPSASRPT